MKHLSILFLVSVIISAASCKQGKKQNKQKAPRTYPDLTHKQHIEVHGQSKSSGRTIKTSFFPGRIDSAHVEQIKKTDKDTLYKYLISPNTRDYNMKIVARDDETGEEVVLAEN